MAPPQPIEDVERILLPVVSTVDGLETSAGAADGHSNAGADSPDELAITHD